ncbi:MAG: MBL fold metallo-hydrolase [Actinomyces sp.]|jgi:metallo-beta-lactamase family protein|nr:MBL fold metallo-hydrolase [Actinomyces sp.]MCI1691675.1 MBL fold metallo-hydrolase [Actinomyces sp.]MCI1787999.1 MBL fold metallo-hydrolase [Actinomyces sp.]MCI1830548.1 MBL fold metallo-hydrolase [Actinomyces sp.]
MGSTTLSFLGAAGTVTGSQHLLTIDTEAPGSADPLRRRRILVDAGMFQGEKRLRLMNWSDFPVPPAAIGDVLLTHAHLDHCGLLPRLAAAGFRGRIWATPATCELTRIVLLDAAHLQERDAAHAADRGYSRHRDPRPLYTVADVEATLPLLREVGFDAPLDLGEGVTAQWTPAGHILGSASIRVATPHGSVVFSGDLGRPEHPVLRPRRVPEGADIAVVESTYGDREHPDPAELARSGAAPPEAHGPLADAIRRTADRGGSVLIPAFAVDRTEVVLKVLSDMTEDGRIPQVPVYVDSPMALASLRVYRAREHAGELRAEADGLRLPALDLREVRDVQDSQRLNAPDRPCLIISASGMATGGRVLHHLEHMLPDPRHCVVLTGYQAAGTRGRALAEGARALKMHGVYVAVRAEVLQDSEFSVHADASELVEWVRGLSPAPREVFCVHGEPGPAGALAGRLGEELGVVAVVPAQGETVRVGGPGFR